MEWTHGVGMGRGREVGEHVDALLREQRARGLHLAEQLAAHEAGANHADGHLLLRRHHRH